MGKYRTLRGSVTEEEEKALNMIVSFHDKKLVDPMCFYCETNLATTMKFSKLACDKCKTDDYISIENPVTARKRTDEQNANRQKHMRTAFIAAFGEDDDNINGEQS